MRTIPLTRGKVALVDEDDFERLAVFKWQAARVVTHAGERWYARRMTSLKDGPRRAVYMHRAVVESTGLVDHRDGNGLDNRKANLRACSYLQNSHNVPKTARKTSSRFKGVTWNGQRWMATIKRDGRSVTLGYSHDEEDCALLYNVGAQLFFGEFAWLNPV